MSTDRLATWGTLVSAIALAACGGSESRPSTPPQPADQPTEQAAPDAQSELLPPVFTAAMIRDATRVGRTYKFAVSDGGTEPTSIIKIVFTKVSEELVSFETYVAAGSGEPMGEPKVAEMPWSVLESHGVFKRADTTISEQTIETAAGTFECTVYVVVAGPDRSSTFYFARELPGAAVRVLHHRNGALFEKLELLEHIAP